MVCGTRDLKCWVLGLGPCGFSVYHIGVWILGQGILPRPIGTIRERWVLLGGLSRESLGA